MNKKKLKKPLKKPNSIIIIIIIIMKASSVVDERGHRRWVLAPTRGPHREVLWRLFGVVVDTLLQFALPVVTVSVVALCTVVTVLRLRAAMAWRLTAASAAPSAASSAASSAQVGCHSAEVG